MNISLLANFFWRIAGVLLNLNKWNIYKALERIQEKKKKQKS